MKADQIITAVHKSGMKLDLFRKDTLDEIVNMQTPDREQKKFTLRVFVRGCTNLSAVDNRTIGVRNVLAGQRAMSSADPYLVIQALGIPEELKNTRSDAKIESLDPDFKEFKEQADINLQENWQLEIKVMDSGRL